MARAEFDLVGPGLGTVQGDCGGGQGHSRILWITFDREPLSYECQYAGAAPAGALLTLALSRGSLLGRLQQPQRAGELVWGDIVLRAETKRIGGLPWGGGRVMGYVFSRDGVEIGGLDMNGMRRPSTCRRRVRPTATRPPSSPSACSPSRTRRTASRSLTPISCDSLLHL